LESDFCVFISYHHFLNDASARMRARDGHDNFFYDIFDEVDMSVSLGGTAKGL